MLLKFGTQSYRHSSLPLSCQEMVNCYLEAAPPAAKTLAAVPACFGIEAFATVGTANRGALVINDGLYVVSGRSLYRVSSTGAATVLGAIPGTDRVSMAGDENNVMIVVSPDAYYFDGSTVQRITDPDFPGATCVTNLDGYFAIVVPDTGQFYISGNRNPGSWNALDFASAEKYPDDLVQALVNYGELVLLGRESGEIWVDDGGADFALSRVPTGIFEKGCSSRFGGAKVDNRVMFPGHDGIVYALNGYQPERISTIPIEQAMAEAVDKDFIGLSWAEAGHTFYGLTCADFTFAYDCSTGLWSRRRSYGAANWQVIQVVRAFGYWLALDNTNRIGKLAPSASTEWDDVLRVSCTSPAVSDENRRLFHDRIELVFEQGTGTVTGQGADPQIMLRHSDDGGRTWSSERWRALGPVGAFKSRAIWLRNGQGRDRVYEYAISDPVRRTLILATTEVRAGAQ